MWCHVEEDGFPFDSGSCCLREFLLTTFASVLLIKDLSINLHPDFCKSAL